MTAENRVRLPSCYECQHLYRERESWEMPHIAWWDCARRPAMINLRSFPFKATKCATFSPDVREPKP